jgi:hypothetical protein
MLLSFVAWVYSSVVPMFIVACFIDINRASPVPVNLKNNKLVNALIYWMFFAW